ncbi:exodeoxyribonuclease V, gamma subunit [Shewanella denitrificans OS217]|uniref:RecBCD enzyme subunit RecC n=1 Tax=Shewanella denitrificans (strain OS217 / ATCC BAA-1090 / DSM 15013) TaxID=318161 RepID=Q12LP5_SHEDO|nr:exodeoxyribonuclease V subunit gamma [Shewanella denitrificans]ABE55631.1 exodeoxyribonuclease V, gamma subunit [Shewanella denitrificans OS217]
MLTLIQSNQMEVLSEQLAKLLATPLDETNLLASEHVLVQSPGMSTWLRLEVARHNGIAAALEFPLPSSFIWQLCHTLLPDVPKDNAFTKPAMTWKLMDLLPRLLDDADFAPLANYLTTELATELAPELAPELATEIKPDQAAAAPDSRSQAIVLSAAQDAIKRYQLCSRIADIFDQYLVYRPEWILAWEQNKPLTSLDNKLKLDDSQLWQPKLWRALIDYNRDELGASPYHRANLHESLLEALADEQSSVANLPQRLFVFGISSMPPQTLEILHQLAGRIPVVMLALSPCEHYWGDIIDPKTRARMALQYADKKQLAQDWESSLEVGNPLLANNGKLGRELLDLMLALPSEHTDFGYDCYVKPWDINLHSDDENDAVPVNTPQNAKLLHGVQYDILQMETLGVSLGPDAALYNNIPNRRLLQPDDDSITIRTCHSPLREVETLHNHLLAMLSRCPQLHPKDIVVMMPDVAAYAPYIDAVFGTANAEASGIDGARQQGNSYIPYAIADRGAAAESPLINSFLSLLNINQSRFALTEIMGILEVPAILRRFKLSGDELSQIRLWLDEANVRWGRDEHSRAALNLPAFEQNSWAFGIRRLILGYAFHDGAPLYQDTLLVPGLEGQSAQALGKLMNFLETLDDYRALFAAPCTTSSRLFELQTLLQDIFEADDDEREEIQAINEAIAKLSEELNGAGHQGMLDIEVLKIWFNQRLSESRVGQRYLAGSVNFCTLMPMRSIPFNMVCLLGMNDGDYPRVQHPVGFDLMAHFGAKKGDRSRRADDRYLFLEALLSAREQLYISYIGQSERDNSERIPSMLVSELIEYCQLCYLTPEMKEQLSKLDEEQILALSKPCDDALLARLIQAQPLQPFDPKLFRDNQALGIALQQSYHSQWCPPSTPANKTTTAPASAAASGSASAETSVNTWVMNSSGRFLGPNQSLPQSILADSLWPQWHSDLEERAVFAATDAELELSALLRFFRNPSQFFFNRSLKVDLSLDIQADDNDEPFSLNALERYLLQAKLLDKILAPDLDTSDLDNNGDDRKKTPEASLTQALKAAGSLPMAPFDELLLSQYQRDMAPLIGRVQFMRGEQCEPRSLNLELEFSFSPGQILANSLELSEISLEPALINSPELAHNAAQAPLKLTLLGRIDDILPKGLINYRPGAAHGRDLVRVYLRHLCLNASGQQQTSYLLDMAQFHSFAPITPAHATAQLKAFILAYIQGQTRPLCFMPRTAFAYVEAPGSHQEKLIAAQKLWRDEQNQLGEGFEPHNHRLFRFPDDFTESGFGAIATTLLSPMLSLYHKGKLSELEDFVSQAAVGHSEVNMGEVEKSAAEQIPVNQLAVNQSPVDQSAVNQSPVNQNVGRTADDAVTSKGERHD